MILDEATKAFLDWKGVPNVVTQIEGKNKIVSHEFEFSAEDLNSFFIANAQFPRNELLPAMYTTLASGRLMHNTKDGTVYASMDVFATSVATPELAKTVLRGDPSDPREAKYQGQAKENVRLSRFISLRRAFLREYLRSVNGRYWMTTTVAMSLDELPPGTLKAEMPIANANGSSAMTYELYFIDDPRRAEYKVNSTIPKNLTTAEPTGGWSTVGVACDTVISAQYSEKNWAYFTGSDPAVIHGVIGVPVDILPIATAGFYTTWGYEPGAAGRPMRLVVSGSSTATGYLAMSDPAGGVEALDLATVVVDREYTSAYIARALRNMLDDSYLATLGLTVTDENGRAQMEAIADNFENANFTARVITYPATFTPLRLREWHSEWGDLPNDQKLGGRLKFTVKQFDNKYAGYPTSYLMFVAPSNVNAEIIRLVWNGDPLAPVWAHPTYTDVEVLTKLEEGSAVLEIDNESLYVTTNPTSEFNLHIEADDGAYSLRYQKGPPPVVGTDDFVEGFVGSRLQEDRNLVNVLLAVHRVHDVREFGVVLQATP